MLKTYTKLILLFFIFQSCTSSNKKDTYKIFTPLSTTKNNCIGFNSTKAINKVAEIENEYFNNYKKSVSKYYGTVWAKNAKQNFINDSMSVFDDYKKESKKLKTNKMHCTIYGMKALKAGLGSNFLEFEKRHKKIWKNKGYAGWSVAYILTKYYNWKAILILSKKSPEYALCIKNFKKDKKYHVYKQPDIPIEKVFDFDDDKKQIENLLKLHEFGWGFSYQGWHTWITRYDKLKECNWAGSPSIKYTNKTAKPLFIKTKFIEFYDYESHVIVFPPRKK